MTPKEITVKLAADAVATAGGSRGAVQVVADETRTRWDYDDQTQRSGS
jgi:hypothetical protein